MLTVNDIAEKLSSDFLLALGEIEKESITIHSYKNHRDPLLDIFGNLEVNDMFVWDSDFYIFITIEPNSLQAKIWKEITEGK